jgi:hypothetical protein
MQLLLHRRAEIALRSLPEADRFKIKFALANLVGADLKQFLKNTKLKKLATGISDKKLFIYRGSTNLRIILSFEGDTCTVEDIVARDRLDRLITQKRKK